MLQEFPRGAALHNLPDRNQSADVTFSYNFFTHQISCNLQDLA